MDCGEGTINQFKRFSLNNNENFCQELIKLKAIFISHIHCDHWIGLLSVIIARRFALRQLGSDNSSHALVLIIPLKLFAILKFLITELQLNNCLRHLILIDSQHLLQESQLENEKLSNSISKIKRELGLEELETAEVSHIPESCGIILRTIEANFKLVYTGDCKPSRSIVERGRNCDLLIHEATYDTNQTHRAFVRFHSTIPQAIDVGHKSNARSLVLTHFNRIISIKALYDSMNSNTLVAQDFMKINKDSFPLKEVDHLRHGFLKIAELMSNKIKK
jgi:ribonuclease Z